MTVGNDQQEDLVLNNTRNIKSVAACKYLGIIRNKHRSTNNKIKEQRKKDNSVTKVHPTICSMEQNNSKKYIYKNITQSI